VTAEQDNDLYVLVSRAVGSAVKLRKHIDEFHPYVYNDGATKKIGYAYDLNHGISEPVAVTLIKSRLQKMGQALMRRAFETNLAGDSARFGVFVDIAERVGDQPVLNETAMWEAAKQKDYWALNEAFLVSPLIDAYGGGKEGRKRVAYLGRVLVQGAEAV
jgi:hypothetical protein